MTAMPAAKRVRVIVIGRVQGVWYRGSMQKQAEQLDVAGWVRNLPDGNVEAVIEGPPSAVDRLIAWCAEGPPSARVHDMQVNEEPVEGLQGFTVRR